MSILGACIDRVCRETLPGALFSRPPRIRFYPRAAACGCGASLKVQKSRQKTVYSLNGPFIACESVLCCRRCNRVYISEDLLRAVPRCCNVGWDVLVFVGRGLFQRHLTTEQMLQELRLKNVALSGAEIGYLGTKFIAYLALGHRLATPRIRDAMDLAGGYVLHLDAAHEADAPAVMTGMDGLSRFVLASVKVPTEHADHIAPFLQRLRRNYGPPVACVHDMGTGICKAVNEVFPQTPDFICHFHFLRDIGKDLLEASYRNLRGCLRKYAISSRLSALVREARQCMRDHQAQACRMARAMTAQTPQNQEVLLPALSTYSLALWCLQAKRSGDGYGFPFDRPLLAFSERLLALMEQLPQLLMMVPAEGRVGNRHFFKLTRKLVQIGQDPLFEDYVKELRWRCKVFDRLRKAMRIAESADGNGLNDDGTQAAMESIRSAVTGFRKSLEQNPELASDLLCRKMARQIDKYGDKLFAEPILVDTPSGKVTIYPQRTNNMMERFFRDFRRGFRRKSGNNTMRKTLQTMLADTPLVKNLDNPDYMEILLNGKTSLEELFADMDMNRSTRQLPLTGDADSILPGFRKLIQLPSLPERVVDWLHGQRLAGKSN